MFQDQLWQRVIQRQLLQHGLGSRRCTLGRFRQSLQETRDYIISLENEESGLRSTINTLEGQERVTQNSLSKNRADLHHLEEQWPEEV